MCERRCKGNLLRITFDQSFSSKQHCNVFYKMGGKNTFARISPYIDTENL